MFFRSAYSVQKGIHFYSMHKAEILILKQNHSVFLSVFWNQPFDCSILLDRSFIVTSFYCNSFLAIELEIFRLFVLIFQVILSSPSNSVDDT